MKLSVVPYQVYKRIRNAGLFLLGASIVLGSLVSARLFGTDSYGITGGTASADVPGSGGGGAPCDSCGCGDSCGGCG